jgi:enamine deaminase RidA (YjgF/YER057c/UK114 family)
MKAIWPDRTPEGLAFTPAYEVESASQLVFLGPITPVRDGKVAPSIEEQSKACLDNLEEILARVPGNARAVKMVQCMSDVRERFAADAVFDEHYVNELPGRLRPAKTLLEVPAVVNHGARIELEVWAIADPAPEPRVLERFAGENGLPVAVATDAAATLHTVEASPGDSAGRGSVEELNDCLAQIEQKLSSVGAGLKDLVKLVIAVSDLRRWPAVQAAIAERLGADAPVVVPQSATKVMPAAATIEVEAWAAVATDGAQTGSGEQVTSVDLAGQLLVISGSAAIPVYIGQTLREMYSYQPVAKIVDQTRVSMDNYAHILKASGASWDDIFKTTWYVTDLREWDRVKPVAEEYFGRPIPAPTVVEVSKFVSPAVRIEPDMWATLPQK